MLRTRNDSSPLAIIIAPRTSTTIDYVTRTYLKIVSHINVVP